MLAKDKQIIDYARNCTVSGIAPTDPMCNYKTIKTYIIYVDFEGRVITHRVGCNFGDSLYYVLTFDQRPTASAK